MIRSMGDIDGKLSSCYQRSGGEEEEKEDHDDCLLIPLFTLNCTLDVM